MKTFFPGVLAGMMLSTLAFSPAHAADRVPSHPAPQSHQQQDRAASSKAGTKAAATSASKQSRPAQSASKPALDRSGRAQHGKASYYADKFAGRKMADGTPMNPQADIAASRTLPLGTKAEVVNLDNGKSKQVEIRDRGPYVDGRIVDVSPKVAKELGMHEDGVAPVAVRPIEVPQEDGSVKPGVAAMGASDGGKTVSGN